MKSIILELLKKHNIEIEEKLLEAPKLKEHGDVSLPCFILSKQLGKNPAQIAKELEEEFNKNKPQELSKIQATGPFLNFTFNPSVYAKELISKYSQNPKVEESQKIVIEFPSPNTNKNLHIGHTRNMLIGNSLYLLLSKVGHNVVTTNLNNDRGISICYAMLGYQKFKTQETQESLNLKSDEYVAYLYAKISNIIKEEEKISGEGNSPAYKEAMNMLEKWEAGDEQVRELWKEVLELVYQGYTKTYHNYKLHTFDKQFYESEVYDKGRDLIEKALKEKVEGIFEDESGAIGIDLEDVKLGTKFLLRSNKTTLYMTQDLYLAQLKEELFSPDKSIFIVGHEQEYHFNVLFEILKRFNLGGYEKNYHFSYGYVFDKEGKKFSSRVGNTIGADEVYELCVNKAKENLMSRNANLSHDELERRAHIIGFGALAFYFLKSAPTHSINFDVEQALSFEGETGPYVQYCYARIQSLLKRGKFNVQMLQERELNFDSSHIPLLEKISKYPEMVLDSAQKYKISQLAHYTMQLCKEFNELYQTTQFIGHEKEFELLYISHLTAHTIKKTLRLLHIDVLDEM
ncbi:MAG: arginine--tRNA ligase [Nanoarchaeota archaeon]|nr:arginine--tRNA ligase [Nanoarchaeota archaeon]